MIAFQAHVSIELIHFVQKLVSRVDAKGKAKILTLKTRPKLKYINIFYN